MKTFTRHHLDSAKLFVLFTTLTLLLATTAACTTEQNGGWKSKGGSNKPVVPPSFSNAGRTEGPGAMTIMVVNPYQLLAQDVLICEKSNEIQKQQFTLNYDVIGTLIGFDLFEIQRQNTLSLIRTLTHLKHDDLVSIDTMELADVALSEDHLEQILTGLKRLDAFFAEELRNIIDSSTVKSPSDSPSLNFYKTSDDGRKCFTANLLEEDLESQTYTNLNKDLYEAISPRDQSMLSLFTALNVFSRRYGMIDIYGLRDFVYYAHTKDFQTDVENVSVTADNLQQLIKAFLPEYESPNKEN
ncbi:MAG: hypothetical protein M9899_01950 [Bdellovibrionaceae bacterium]|nr:hypothetical protein [Pseudobdellovibrionaceae bacterium]